jgi:magnesium transporter
MAETPEDIGQKLQALLDSRDLRAVKRSFREFETADLGEALTALPLETCLALFRLLPRKRRAETFAYLPFERQEQLLEELPDLVVTPILNDMEPDDRTRLLEELPFELRSKLLLRLTPEERKIAWQLLSHPEGSVGRLMTPELFDLSAEMQVNEVLAMLRWAHTVPEDQLNTLFVTDEKGRCVGEVSLATLVTADPPTRKVVEVMQPHQALLRASDEQSVAVDFFRKYDRSSFPVVDDQGVLVGIVTADDVFDVAEEEATEDIQQFGGQSTLEDSYFETPLLTLFRKRAGWLALLFVGGTMTAACIKHYEGYSDAMGWLVFFLPLIVSAGGNTGSQSASLVIRGIAVREMELKDWFRVMWREIAVGLALGLILGAMGYLRAAAWHLEPVVGISVAVSVAGVVVFGSVTGAMLPFLFKRLKLDPAVISSPLLAQTVDIVGVLVFYNVAAAAIAHWQRMLGP